MTPVTHDLVHTTQNAFGTAGLAAQIPFGLYLFKRLLSVGVKSVFGVPGDYNLRLLEHMYDDSLKDTKGDTVEWVGCCNELNAAYAADGYSRYTNNIGTVITTFGVGELGAISGLAGACSENVKVLHIVGVIDYENKPEMKSRNYHHLVPRLNDSNFLAPDYRVYADMVKDRIACSVEYLDDLSTAADKVDKVIEDIYKYSKPGYLFVPCTLVDGLISSKNLIERPTISLLDSVMKTAPEEAQELTDKILNLLYESVTPGIVGDVLCDRYGLTKDLNELIKATGIVGFSSVMGKSIIDESTPQYMGLYNGKGHLESVDNKFLSCDLVLHFGVEKNEVNYGNYTYPFKADAKVVELHPEYIRFYDNLSKEESIHKNVNFVDIMSLLIKQIDLSKVTPEYGSKFTPYNPDDLKLDEKDFGNDETSDITQVYLQKHLPEFLNPADVLICETGSFQFGVRDFKLPSQVKYISQGLYLSIGMALPAALGVAKGMRDYPNHHVLDYESVDHGYQPRLILLEGDGAAQMTIQELSTIMHHQIPLEIFLWNNNGYTIERVIEGPTRNYNDIAPWKWTKILEAFGDFDGKNARNTILESRPQLLEKLSELKSSERRKGIDFMEVRLATMDVPSQLRAVIDDLVDR